MSEYTGQEPLKPLADVVIEHGSNGFLIYWSQYVEPTTKATIRNEFQKYGQYHQDINNGEFDQFVIIPLYDLHQAFARLTYLLTADNVSYVSVNKDGES